jgi:hypothetical protein
MSLQTRLEEKSLGDRSGGHLDHEPTIHPSHREAVVPSLMGPLWGKP